MILLYILSAIGVIAILLVAVLGVLGFFVNRWEDEDAEARIERRRGRANKS